MQGLQNGMVLVGRNSGQVVEEGAQLVAWGAIRCIRVREDAAAGKNVEGGELDWLWKFYV